MAINFSSQRWEKVKETYRSFWAGELDRPVISVVVGGREPGRSEPELPRQGFTGFYDLSVSPEDIVDRWGYDLSCNEYLGDSFPYVFMNFGPGVMAAFMGAELCAGNDTIWYQPTRDIPIEELHFEYDPDNVWLNRIRDIYSAGIKRWQGQVLMSMTDLGGNLDVLSTFRPSEKLLLDLYDFPDEVKRLTWEAHELWHRFFNELNDTLQPVSPGYAAWDGMFSEQPFYMLQCDFNYMLGLEMFNEFVKPELEETCKKLPNNFYHLDGPGQLVSLDSLLEIEQLDGVQWIPGAGAPSCEHWPEVYRKIHAAGKKAQICGGSMENIDTIVEQVGADNFFQTNMNMNMTDPQADQSTIRRWLAKYRIE